MPDAEKCKRYVRQRWLSTDNLDGNDDDNGDGESSSTERPVDKNDE